MLLEEGSCSEAVAHLTQQLALRRRTMSTLVSAGAQEVRIVFATEAVLARGGVVAQLAQ